MRTPARVLLALCGLLALAGPAAGLRALGLFPLASHSHNAFFKALMEELAARGHQVVMFSAFPHKEAPANYTDIDTSGGKPPMINTFSFDKVSSEATLIPGQAMYGTISRISAFAGKGLCREVFSMPEFQKAMNGGYGNFDVVFTEIFGSDCWAAAAYKLKVPLISLSSAPDVSWMHERFGSVDNPSYLANVFTSFRSGMTFWERLVNSFTTIYVQYLHQKLMNEPSDEVVQEFFGDDTPPISELVKQTSLVLLNRHVSIHAARPVTPNVVHVGGLHVKAPETSMDPELQKWMDEAEHGVIFFSLGSLMRSDTLPVDKRDALLWAFSQLPQRVIWKFETDNIELPANVRIGKWFPQMNILTHPKTVLFMTHGGLMGTLEALHSSVPLLGIPLFADQMSNTELYKSLGIAGRLDIRTATKESILAVLREMTENTRYRERAREVAALFRDRPRQAADEAVWWTEYVVRNHGAKHLRPLGADLPLYQYLLLDVVAFLAACALLTVFVLWRIVAALVRSVRPATKAVTKKKQS